jgi:hypothetical protein
MEGAPAVMMRGAAPAPLRADDGGVDGGVGSGRASRSIAAAASSSRGSRLTPNWR